LKPSEKIKLLGFKSLQEAADSAEESKENLIRWSTSYPRRFELILKGLAFERINEQLNAVFEEIEEGDPSDSD
tara:strand:+ start:6 stop:224 length:219 start_codon:yes stop_codon:yes gene_type:complete